jgi:hypothetical protein
LTDEIVEHKGMNIKLRNAIGNYFIIMLQFAVSIGALSGMVLAIILGKFFAAVILAALLLGIYFRFSGRLSSSLVEADITSPWVKLLSAILALVEVGVLVEAANFPVRFNQAGFEKQNWLIVIFALLALYFLQARFFRAVLGKRQVKNAASDITTASNQNVSSQRDI